MTDINRLHDIPVKKFQRLLDYLEHVGIDSKNIAQQAGLDAKKLLSASENRTLPGYKYSALYEYAAEAMQEMDIAVPWGAGIGSDVFRFMCYSIINCQNLEAALNRAARYQKMLYPITGYKITINTTSDITELRYEFNSDFANKQFTPKSWDRNEHSDAVAKASGLRVWFAFIGWLTARELQLTGLTISAPPVSDAYTTSMGTLLGITPEFNAEHTALFFNSSALRARTVHTPTSLEAFLQHAVYSLITQDSRPASTSAAIRSLLANSGTGSLPSFEAMAEDLHMSPSSLRRRLHSEDTSYQELKDQYRCDIAMRQLRNPMLKIHEIGEQLGFLESSSFIRSFRNWAGLTPKQFRDQLDDIDQSKPTISD
ncbi:AraC family transcriptional regulator [Zhongshania sp.]|jgi:AraC-like DNA-binding protein|uniref:AraC family transcriptional regulator n=1 Tax=Zhongshania sp. TaxID=1971902 RepID=UPI002A82EDAB|nr:AraC family transcriptional regulator ligand-binding domain-containing protein [Zhongshania sp.]